MQFNPYSAQAVPYKTFFFDSENKTIWHLCYPMQVEIWTLEVCNKETIKVESFFLICHLSRLFQQAHFAWHTLG